MWKDMVTSSNLGKSVKIPSTKLTQTSSVFY